MNEHILEAIDEEIARLRQVRAILTDRKVPRGKKAVTPSPKPAEKTRRKMSPKARRAIAEGQRKRWANVAKQKKDGASSTAG